MLFEPQSASSTLALVTTLHLAIATLRNKRRLTSSPLSLLAAVSLAFTALPWIFPSAIGLGLGILLHAAWFGACELMVPKAITSAVKTSPRTASPARAPSPQPSAPAAAPRPRATGPAEAARPKGFVTVPVLATFDETPTIKTIRFARPEGFDFEAGQFITVRVPVDGKDYARCYSISSAPIVRGYLEISVKRQGLVSNALHATARPGGTLSLKSPAGAFRYPAGDVRPLVLLACGIGITPLMSMLRHAVTTEPSRPVTLIYCAKTEADFAFGDELASLSWRHPQLRVQLAASKEATQPHVYPGRIDENLLRTTVLNLPQSIALLCGPTKMIEDMKPLLASLGVPAGQIRYEAFEAAVAASAVHTRDDRRLPASADDERPMASRPGAGSTHRLMCAKSRRHVAIRQGQTLLEAAEEGGVAIDSLCRAGVCGTCRVQVSDGDVNCESDTLDADDQSQGFVLACVTTTRTDCTVNL